MEKHVLVVAGVADILATPIEQSERERWIPSDHLRGVPLWGKSSWDSRGCEQRRGQTIFTKSSAELEQESRRFVHKWAPVHSDVPPSCANAKNIHSRVKGWECRESGAGCIQARWHHKEDGCRRAAADDGSRIPQNGSYFSIRACAGGFYSRYCGPNRRSSFVEQRGHDDLPAAVRSGTTSLPFFCSFLHSAASGMEPPYFPFFQTCTFTSNLIRKRSHIIKEIYK